MVKADIEELVENNQAVKETRDTGINMVKEDQEFAAARTNFVEYYSHASLYPVQTYIQRPELHDRIREQLRNITGGYGEHSKKRYRKEYKATFWIEAGRKASIERDVINIYKLLFNVRASTGQETIAIDDAVVAFKSWFSSRVDRCLVVFDRADEEDDGDFFDLPHYMPESPAVHIIITTRSRTAKDITMLEVNVREMDEQQAVDLFYKSSRLVKRDNETEKEVERIVKELGCLALAVNLAGTYVSRTPRLHSDIKGYLPEYGRRRQELFGRKPEKLVHQYGQSVLTTWETSFRAVDHKSSGAAKLLTMMAFLNFDDIYMELFGANVEPQEAGPLERPNRHLSWGATVSPGKEMDIYKLEKYFEVLEMYSFVEWKGDQNSYSMHKLVHAWGYDRLQEEEQESLSLGALQLVHEAASNRNAELHDKLRLVPHLIANFNIVVKSISRLESVKQALDKLTILGLFMSNIGR
ncbi:MAG: hypothetical protein M1840_003140 [Geoglossum simile]|nr:MAG: hypothetical protein M1840_003140 [Geoglossum simile]